MEKCSSYQCQLNTLGVVGRAVGWASRWFTAILMTFQSFGCLICFIHLFCGVEPRHESSLAAVCRSRCSELSPGWLLYTFIALFWKAILWILDVILLYYWCTIVQSVDVVNFPWIEVFCPPQKWFSLISSISSYSEPRNSCCPLLFSWFR